MFERTGYRYVEIFTTWTNSRLDSETEDPKTVRSQLEQYELMLSSLNLNNLKAGNKEERRAQLDAVRRGIDFAASLGTRIVNVKGGGRTDEDMKALIEDTSSLAEYIDGMTVDGEPMILCLGNHLGNRLQELTDFQTVFQHVDHPQVRVLVDIGHFHSARTDAATIMTALSSRIGLVHTKDQIGKESVPFGNGEIDNPKLLALLSDLGYSGFLVVEIEVEDKESIERYLADAKDYLEEFIAK